MAYAIVFAAIGLLAISLQPLAYCRHYIAD
jgi:hypothetical protein